MGPYKKYFKQTIQQNFPAKSADILLLTEENYKRISPDTQFAATSKNPIDRRLDFCSYFLALIMALEKNGEDYASIRKNCLEITEVYVLPKNKLQAWAKRLPQQLVGTWFGNIMIKKLGQRFSKNENAGGFIANIITSKGETYGLGYGIDILECGICKLFNKHEYSKYASILCEVDELTSGLAGLELIRTGTIANGAAKCDFRFKRK